MEPFNLQRAQAGEPIQTRGGKKAKFIAHIPECHRDHKVLIHIEDHGSVLDYREDGTGQGETYALIMAPKPPRKATWLKLDNGDTILDVPESSDATAVPKGRTVIDRHDFDWPADARWPWECKAHAE
jgi:hypothetical protein